MKYTKYKNGAYNIHLINTDRFKTVSIRINFKRKTSKEEVTKRNLLTRVLLESNEFYSTSRLIEIETEKLYGLMLRSSSTISGNYSVMSFESSFLNNNYTNDDMLSNALDFILSFIFNPDIVDKKFNEKNFNICYESLKQEILSLKENPNRYGMLKMLEFMDNNAPYSICADGNIEDLEKITSENLYEYYKEIIKSDLIDIFVIGDFNIEFVKGIINDKFKINTLKKPTTSHYIKHNKINRKPKSSSEKRILEQSKLYIGCKLDDLTPFEQKYVMNIYSFILGGSPNSKLFMELREKNSLCYNVSSIYNPVFNLLIIKAGIDAEAFKQSVTLIKQELKNMEKGLFEEEDIKAGIITYKNTFKEVLDSPFSILNTYTSCEYLDYDPIDKRIIEIDKVDRKAIMDVCKKIHIDTIFLLEGNIND
ncbi:MAG: insulinase family protein [Bacilli bacterium]|nr:insulinase family protein [Bacilli bacterium]